MAEEKIFQAPGLDLQHLGRTLARWFQKQGFETQLLQAPREGMVVQIRRQETWRSFLGLSAALNVTMTRRQDVLVVQMGAAKWVDKAVLGAVGVLVFWPALIPAAFGAWQQRQLPQQVFQVIDQYLVLMARTRDAPPAQPPEPTKAASPALLPDVGTVSEKSDALHNGRALPPEAGPHDHGDAEAGD